MRAIDPISPSSLPLVITKGHVKFHPYWINSFREKGEQTKRQTKVAYYDIHDQLYVTS